MPAPEKHPIPVTTPVGDALWLREMSGIECLGQPFKYELLLLSKDGGIKLEDLVGKTIAVELPVLNNQTRYFHGHVASFSQSEKRGELHQYSAVLRPWFWLLTRTSDCRIFQKMTARDIIKQVFRDRGFSDFSESLSGTYREREYCVQYRETDFNFVSRLMEEEGIYYYFRHEKTKHTLVLCDSANAHRSAPGYEKIAFHQDEGHGPKPDQISGWETIQELQACKYVLRDFDFLNPQANLETQASASADRRHQHKDKEVYDYPGLYAKSADGETYVKTRLQELQAGYAQVAAVAGSRGLGSGHLFQLTDHPRADQNRQYLVVSDSFDVLSSEFEGTDLEAAGTGFQMRMTAIPSNTPYRSPRLTPKPFVQGPQTAIVVGKKGDEIYTDEHGRVKVQFHWDRLGKKDENSSCWIRVSSTWAGNAWGAIQLPRIGQEVIVDFLEGDPDRPIITGRVYNADNKPPYTLPANMTQSGVKSRSTKEGTTETFNELRFEDKKDAEEIYFHAEKDFNRVVENNDTLKVGFEKKDQGDQTVEIHNNQKLVVGNKDSADGSQTIEIWKNRTATVKEGNEKITIEKGNRDVIVSKGNDTLTITQGNQTIKISAGKSTTEAAQSIELKVGGSSIKITPTGITLKSTMIKIEAEGMFQVKGGFGKVEASGILEIKGGVVKIN